MGEARNGMRAFRHALAAVSLVLLCVVHAKQEKEDNDNDDIPMEPTLPKMEGMGSDLVENAEAMQFSEKIPKHLAQHYRKNGPDNIVYFSFCIG